MSPGTVIAALALVVQASASLAGPKAGGGVAPLETPKDRCERAAFHSPPATEREWLAVTFDVQDLRIHRHGEEGMIPAYDAKWGADSLSIKTRWVRGRAIADSLTIPWSEIESIEKPIGRQTALGAGVGAFAGLGVAFGVAYALEHDCSGFGCGFGFLVLSVVTVPAGAVIGAIVGSNANKWGPIYCEPPTKKSKRPAHSRK